MDNQEHRYCRCWVSECACVRTMERYQKLEKEVIELKKENKELKGEVGVGMVGDEERKFFIQHTSKVEKENKELKDKMNKLQEWKNNQMEGWKWNSSSSDESEDEGDRCYNGDCNRRLRTTFKNEGGKGVFCSYECSEGICSGWSPRKCAKKERCDNGDCNGGRAFKNEGGKGEFCSYECAESICAEEHDCCFPDCEETFKYGNNAGPVAPDEKCCDDCNMRHVIPARLGIVMGKE